MLSRISQKDLDAAFSAEFPPLHPPEGSADGSAGDTFTRAQVEEMMDQKLQELKEKMNQIGMPQNDNEESKGEEENGSEENNSEGN